MNTQHYKVRAFLRPFYELFYPPICFACGGVLSTDEGKVCTACWSAVRKISAEDSLYRETLGRLISEGHVCRLASAYHFEKDGTLQSLIHHLKYGGITALGVELGRKLGDCVQTTLGGVLISGILPVPLHPTKRRERGYNQSEYICQGVHERTGLPVCQPLLMRRKYTKSQTELDIDQRKENVRGAFGVHSSFQRAIQDQTFLIVDDIITTGSTVDACAEVLVEHGAKQVFAASVALAN